MLNLSKLYPDYISSTLKHRLSYSNFVLQGVLESSLSYMLICYIYIYIYIYIYMYNLQMFICMIYLSKTRLNIICYATDKFLSHEKIILVIIC